MLMKLFFYQGRVASIRNQNPKSVPQVRETTNSYCSVEEETPNQKIKIDKPLARLIRKRNRTQINNIRNKRSDITIYSTDIKIIRKYYD